MDTPCYSVIAADDHPVVLSGIRLALRETGKFRLLAETEDASRTLAAIRNEVPDLLILDLWMGSSDGIGLLREIHEGWPAIRVLVYSMNDEGSYGVRALRAGAAGYLMKSHGLDELVRALGVIASGERYISSALACGMINLGAISNSSPGNTAVLSGLSDREMQILRLIGRGHTTAAISKNLNISAKTVGAHRENLKNKLNAGNSATLASRAAQWVADRIL